MNRHDLFLRVMSVAVPVSLIGVFFRIEKTLRKGEAARTLSAKEEDRHSTRFLGLAIGLCLISILISPLFNFFEIAYVGRLSWLAVGFAAMLAGLVFRTMAAVSLGKFYTRTLTKLPDHQLHTTGIYRYIRNPGYLGTLMLFGGAGLASNNYIALGVSVLLPLAAYLYRIRAEEAMLMDLFGENFRSYKKRSWRLIPFIY
jgi:protein-S-isoprenylcysteine O-methyltransferase Ste14